MPQGQIARTDENGHTYYEIHANNDSGNLGGSVPYNPGGGWAKRVTISTIMPNGQPSYWAISSDNQPVYADGAGPGTTGEGRVDDGRKPTPGHKWGLVACWVAVDNQQGGVQAISGWYEIGVDGTVIDVPIPGGIIPTPTGVSSYNPAVQLLYLCNDEKYDDNSGWLHVYENWSY